MRNKVWITGAGCLTNLGSGFDSAVAAVQSPHGHFAHIPSEWLDLPNASDTFLARLHPQAESALQLFETISTDRATAMALAAADQAWTFAGLTTESLSSADRAGVYWGTGMGGLDTVETTYRRTLMDRAPLRPMTVVRIMANAAAAQIALKYRLQGANQTYSVACASSAIAIGEAMWAIRSGRLDVAIVGGAEAMLTPVVMAAWGALRVMATRAHTLDPNVPCRPFSANRSGLVIGEGAAALVLESEHHARARGAAPLAEIAGYATNCDATSLVQPNQQGQTKAMLAALLDASLSAPEIDSLNAHATATDAGDKVEASALAAVFGAHCPPIAATKAMHGHLLGAAGAVEAVMCLAALQLQTTPATLGLNPIDAAFQNLPVAENPQPGRIRAILSNSFAFGGSNASLIFKVPT